MKTLWKLFHSIWLITLVMAFHLALPAFASTLSFGPSSFAYDGQNQAKAVYDAVSQWNFDYDSAVVLSADGGASQTAETRHFFGKCAEFLAAEGGTAAVQPMAEAAEETAGVVGEAAQAGGRAPNFIVSEGGTVYPVPEGATGPFPAESGKGFQFTGGSGGNGLSPSATDFRFMDPVTTGKYQYPGGYGSYGNAAGQTINPLTGQTIARSNPWWHIPGQ